MVSLYMLKWCYRNLPLSKIKCDLGKFSTNNFHELKSSDSLTIFEILLLMNFHSGTLWSKHVCVVAS